MKLHQDTTTFDLLGSDSANQLLESLETSSNCVVLLSPQGRIMTASLATVAALGLECRTEVLGRHWCKTWPSSTHAALSEAVRRALDGKILTYWAQTPNSDGLPTDWDIRISPVFDDNGTVSSVLAVSRPVTKH